MAGRSRNERFQSFRRSNAYLVLASIYSVTWTYTGVTMLQPILPFYLRNLLKDDVNCTYASSNATMSYEKYTDDVIVVQSCENSTELRDAVSEAIGVICGSGSVMMLISSILSGLLIEKLPLRVNLFLSFVLGLLGPACAFFANDIAAMCFAYGFSSVGVMYGFVCFGTLYSEYADNQRQLTWFHGLYRICSGIGYIIGYVAASASYQFLGHKATFGTLFIITALDVFGRAGLVMKKKAEVTAEAEAVAIEVQEPAEETPTEPERKNACAEAVRLLIDPFIILASVEVIILYIGTSIFWGTAPNFIATQLGAEQYETGIVMGVGTAVDLVLQFIATVTINTHRRRIASLVVAHLCIGLGYFWYPLVATIWIAIPPDAIVRSCKDIIALLLTTTYPHICEVRSLRSQTKLTYAVMTSAAAAGVVIGYYLSGVLVVWIGFRDLYFVLGAVSVITGLTVPVFLLLPSKDLLPPESGQTADQAGLRGRTASKLSLHKSNLSLSIQI